MVKVKKRKKRIRCEYIFENSHCKIQRTCHTGAHLNLNGKFYCKQHFLKMEERQKRLKDMSCFATKYLQTNDKCRKCFLRNSCDKVKGYIEKIKKEVLKHGGKNV